MGAAADRGVERAKHVTNPDFQKEPGRKYMSVALVYWPDGVLQNMSPRTCEFKKILCLNRVFTDVIKLTWGHFGVEWELIRRWVSLQEEENVDTDGHTRKEAGHMRMEAETGKHCHKPRSANCRQPTGAGIRKEGFSLELAEGAWLALLICWLGRINFYCFKLLSLRYFFYSDLRKQIHLGNRRTPKSWFCCGDEDAKQQVWGAGDKNFHLKSQ